MKKYFLPLILVLLALIGAIFEGLTTTLSPRLVQAHGLLIIVTIGIYVSWVVRVWYRRH